MTDQEILQKAIEKAVKNGWTMFGYREGKYEVVWEFIHPILVLQKDDGNGNSIVIESFRYQEFIFDHSFAKAFWGSKNIEVKPDWAIDASYRMGAEANHETIASRVRAIVKAWQWHLQQMVLEENPIQYLRRFI